ncbi:MAG: CDP-diacylglycerol--glycerol-3-phosphate 3-phosphatidyltransferase [Ignavibacteriales bacterium CG07_land_8_20_14_0_80_59_12]|nr:MAG: CDP-diacylglycerol--glycerol-3-phosphate 3-phosphatidyltransferase [Ignavibacteriales bacterium CG07_land_8_20_14_0_80_59_12]
MTPSNQLTVLRIILTPVFVVLFLSESPTSRACAVIVFFAAAITDWYDGWVARTWGYQSRWGRFLDPLADKILSSAAFIAFMSVGLLPVWMVWIIVVRDISITLLRSYMEFQNKPITTTRGAKAKTFAQFTLIYYLLVLFGLRQFPVITSRIGGVINVLLSPTLIYIAMLLVTAATLWTGIAYLIDNLRHLFLPVGDNAEQ